jgi:hypothetical protein
VLFGQRMVRVELTQEGECIEIGLFRRQANLTGRWLPGRAIAPLPRAPQTLRDDLISLLRSGRLGAEPGVSDRVGFRTRRR